MKKLLLLCALMFTIPSFASGIDANATSAPCDNATLETYGGTANVEINWEPNTINLIWRNGDQLVSGPTTCTYDGALNIPETPPTRTGYTFIGWKLTVPPGYTELEYIESTGTQYIDTGIKGDQDTKAEIKFVVTAKDCNAFYAVFGARQSNYSQAFNLWAPLSSGFIGVNFSDYGALSSNVQFNVDTTYVVELSKTGLVINDILKTMSQTSAFTTPTNIILFNINGGRSPSGNGLALNTCGGNRAFVGNVYYFRLHKNNSLVLNMIPAKRNSDNVVGMWDTVTQTFFTNAGTGAFTAGPTVQ